MHYYNENDPFAAAWLAELMKAGLIPLGQIDTRSIVDVRGGELEGFTQCHFFAGIGGWPYALRLAAWPEDRPVWTGSCPCQPFSVAGKGKGTDDERHLWPEFQRLIAECRPPVVLGEQVASAAGRQWLAGVRTDLETLGYAVGGADLCAAGVGAPHIRQRLYWVGHANEPGSFSGAHPGIYRSEKSAGSRDGEPERPSSGSRVADTDVPVPGEGWEQRSGQFGRAGGDQENRVGRSRVAQSDDTERRPDGSRRDDGSRQDTGRPEVAGNAGECGQDRRVADTAYEQQHGSGNAGPRGWNEPSDGRGGSGLADTDDEGSQGWGCPVDGERAGERSPWSLGASWLDCRDGKRRRVEPGIPLLAHGVPNRVGKLRGFGNAIVPWVAAEFIKAFRDVA